MGDADHVQLTRLVTEVAWRIDNGKADTVHELSSMTARRTCYFDEGDGPGTTVPFTVGEDHDRFVRTDPGWRFVYRGWDALFVRR